MRVHVAFSHTDYTCTYFSELLTRKLMLDYFVDKAKQSILDSDKMLVFSIRLLSKHQK